MDSDKKHELSCATQVLLDYLSITDPPRKADIIWGLGSNDIQVAEKCAQLFHLHLAPIIAFSGGNGHRWKDLNVTEAELFRNTAMECSVPDSCIIMESKSTHTGGNVAFTLDILDSLKLNLRSVLLVTIPPFQLRAKITVNTQRSFIECINCPITWGTADTWDEHRLLANAKLCIGEIRRLREYPDLGFITWNPDQIPYHILSAKMKIDEIINNLE